MAVLNQLVKGSRLLRLTAAMAVVVTLVLVLGLQSRNAVADDDSHSDLDPVRNVPLACEFLSTPGLAPRSAKNIVHVTNVCGFVGTDVEFQSRTDAGGKVRDFAFVGTIGGGMRIFDITDPAHPFAAGAYQGGGWQGDVQVRGDIATIGYDPVLGEAITTSTCLQEKDATGGVDVVRLNFDPETANFAVSLIGCVANHPGGAHTNTLNPNGEWLALSNPRTDGSVDVVDLRGDHPEMIYRIIGEPTTSTCPADASFECIVTGHRWSPHDLHFSADGNTMYVAAARSAEANTLILDVSDVLNGNAGIIAKIPRFPEDGGFSNPNNVEVSHQSDVTPDGKLLLVTDERGGGVGETDCNTDENGVIGGMHFWALDEIAGVPASEGASPATPQRIGAWFYPNPTLALDPLQPILETMPRTERSCTTHVFRIGGNGTASPGAIHPDFDGVSGLPEDELVMAHYGAGVWHLGFSKDASTAAGAEEDSRTTWGNTLGWNVMPGTDMWSAKEYKGYIYAGDMLRGFDVYKATDCDGVGCIAAPPPNSPGKATGGGQSEDELAEFNILRGTTAGGAARFNLNIQFESGDVAPGGHLRLVDKAAGKEVTTKTIDTFTVSGNRAVALGRATVNDVPGIPFFLEVEDGGQDGDDTFRLVLGDGYGTFGVVSKGNIKVEEH